MTAALAVAPTAAPKVGIFFTGIDHTQDTVLAAFGTGIPADMRVAAHLDKGAPEPIDVAVVYGTRKRNVVLAEKRWRIIEAMRLGGGRTIILESGYLHRDRYFSAGWNDINGRADFRLSPDMPPDRWDALGIEMKPWKTGGDYVLVCGQRPHGSGAVGLNDFDDWRREHIRALWQKGIKVKYRPHPGIAIARPLALDLAEASACFTWNTTAGVEAVVAGVPTIAMDQGSMVWDVAGHGLDDIDNPPRPGRSAWARRLAYCQWTLDEMAEGQAWRHLTRP